ncbi:hypothetical protein F4604DRAFT_2044122, partial [Suillus subluteus]
LIDFCLLVIFGCVKSSGKDIPFSPAEEVVPTHHKRMAHHSLIAWQLRARRWSTSHRDNDETEFDSLGPLDKWRANLVAEVHGVLGLYDDLRRTTEDQNALQRDGWNIGALKDSISSESLPSSQVDCSPALSVKKSPTYVLALL